jgi:biopolymer transport protein ExbB
MLKILSSVAPLIGLLGTVAGMMLSISSAADNAGNVADGISKALITTQAGLVVAIPSWIIAMVATSQMQTLLIKIAKRETAMIKGGLQ